MDRRSDGPRPDAARPPGHPRTPGTEKALSVSAEDPAPREVADGLQKWLSKRLPGGEQLVISEIKKPSSGFSAQTWLIDLADAASGEFKRRVVARIETADPAVYPRQARTHAGNPAGDVEVALQYQVMRSLHRAGGIPLAGLIGYEAEPQLLGQPFFVMDYVDGLTLAQLVAKGPLPSRHGNGKNLVAMRVGCWAACRVACRVACANCPRKRSERPRP